MTLTGLILRRSRLALIALSLVGFSTQAAASGEVAPDLIRRIELKWEPMEAATNYEIEFGLNPDFSSTLYSQKIDDMKFNVDVLPGSYYYRVRAVDNHGRPGQWTDVQELNVNARPPVLLWPQNGEIIQGNLPDTGIPMEWRTSGPGIRYLVEIKGADADGKFTNTIVKQEVTGTVFPFFPQEPGKFQWLVHTLGTAGDEPGAPWEFSVEGVIPRNVVVPPGMTPKRIVRYVAPWWRNHWTLFARYGQAEESYNIVDQDLRATSDFTGFTGYVDLTLNWEWHDPVKWTFNGIPWVEGEFELDRQTVLNESVILPRQMIRVGSWYDEWLQQWRFSPILEFGSRDMAIYQPSSATAAARVSTTRDWLGIGVEAERRLKPFLVMSGWLKYRFEWGGQGGFVPVQGDQFAVATDNRAGDLASGTAIEAGLAATAALSPKMFTQGRLRFESFSAAWSPIFPIDPNSPAPGQPTQFSETNLSFDISFGYKF